MDEPARRVAENEDLFRQVNDHVIAGAGGRPRISRSSANARTRAAWIMSA